MAQSKPEKLVYVGDNGPWHYVMVEEVAPAFEKATGIKVDFTLLPVDPVACAADAPNSAPAAAASTWRNSRSA